MIHTGALVCLFGFAANALGLYHLLLPTALILLILQAPHQFGTTPLDLNLVTLCLFSAAYSLATPTSAGQVLLNFLYPLGYLVGLVAVRSGRDPHIELRRLILTIVAGATLHGLLNAVTNVWTYGWLPGARVLPDVWTQEPLTATLQATLFVPLVGVAYYGMTMRQEHRPLVVVLTGSSLLVAAAYNLATASRTIFVIALLTLIACTLVPPGRRLPRMAILAGFFMTILALYLRDILGVKSLVESSALMERLTTGQAPGFDEDPRFERWAYVVDNFWDHMGGGLHFRADIGYVHNLWLDAYDVAGFWAFIALLGFTWGALALLRKTLVAQSVSGQFKVMVVGLWVALLAQFMTEPILDGMPILFIFFCVVCGGVAGIFRTNPSPNSSWQHPRIAMW